MNYVAVQMGGDALSGTLAWNGRQLESLTNSMGYFEYVYNADGLRTKKYMYTDSTKTTLSEYWEYIWNGDRLVGYMRYTSDGELDVTLKILYDTNGEAVGFTTGGAADTYLYEKNLYGDVTGIYDENGTKWLTYSYDAWGNATVSATGNTFAHIITYALLAALNPITYRGYQYDMETGLYYLQSRYYNPEWGRFLNADVYADTNEYGFGANIFTYCENDSVNYIDPQGTWAYDVHCGYYKTTLNRAESKSIILRRSVKEDLYLPYVIAYGRLRPYGTYYWVREGGLRRDYALIVADACNYVDTLYSPANIFSSYYQSFHFNVTPKDSVDSRISRAFEMFGKAIDYFDAADDLYQNNKAGSKKYKENIKQGLTYIGYMLHPLQDVTAHTPERCYLVRQGVILFWSHIKYRDTDSVQKRYTQMFKNAEFTIGIAQVIMAEYGYMLRNT